MNTKKELDADWTDTMQTLESLRSVIVKQRKKWWNMIANGVSQIDIAKLHKESEVLEHMGIVAKNINRTGLLFVDNDD